jgi:hypothetical protein
VDFKFLKSAERSHRKLKNARNRTGIRQLPRIFLEDSQSESGSPAVGRLVALATTDLVANGVDANANAVVDFMNAKSMIGSMHASPIVSEKFAEQGAGIDIILVWGMSGSN